MANSAPIDGWTALHALSGVGLGLLGVPLPVTGAALIGYEIAEYAIEYPRGSPLFGTKRPETASNAAMDLAVGLGAYALTVHLLSRSSRK